MRKSFSEELKNLNRMLIEMGNKVERVIEVSIESLIDRDKEKAKTVKLLDDEVDILEEEIEEKCLELFALQTPVAKDLRVVSSILKIITDLERIGDYGVNISNIIVNMTGDKYIKPLVDIPRMAEICREMTRKSLDSFVDRDPDLALETLKMDDIVDDLYDRINIDLMERIDVDKEVVVQIIDLLFIARHLERMGDHVTNICERIVYINTGEKDY